MYKSFKNNPWNSEMHWHGGFAALTNVNLIDKIDHRILFCEFDKRSDVTFSDWQETTL